MYHRTERKRVNRNQKPWRGVVHKQGRGRKREKVWEKLCAFTVMRPKEWSRWREQQCMFSAGVRWTLRAACSLGRGGDGDDEDQKRNTAHSGVETEASAWSNPDQHLQTANKTGWVMVKTIQIQLHSNHCKVPNDCKSGLWWVIKAHYHL